MIVSMMRMPESKQANHIDQETKRADDEQFLDSPQLPPFGHTFSSLPNELNTDEHQEYAVSKTRKSVELAPSVRHLGTRRPFRGNGSAKTDNETQAIEEHVYSVAKESERATEIAV